MLTRSIDALANGRDLSAEQTAEVLAEIMSGNASDVQIAAFLIALRTKGETVDELAGLPDDTIRKIMGGNLARLMNVKDEVLR